MAFVDHIEIYIKAGRGGDGVVRWRHEKFIPKGGPAGGNGGRGGHVYVVGKRAMHTLQRYAHQKLFEAENGKPGEGNVKQGAQGTDLVIEFPVGTVLTNQKTKERISIDTEGDQILVLKGGRGGLGNEHFKGPTNTTPKESTEGQDGEEGEFEVDLELFADIGLVGLPNAGKSSLLNSITNADAKVGDYQFTTLDPNLGDFYGYIIADIPGLIEGAAEGRGLGHKFLRHVKRTKMLLHLISAEHKDDASKIYASIRNELKAYDQLLVEKEEVIVITKTDLVNSKELENIKKQFKGQTILELSLYDDQKIEVFKKELSHILQNKMPILNN